ncbi:MAG: 6-phosphogluconolactonase [Desulfocapsaceae bacterium]|nr:6-phosphogluconolactonase [Desulfocapsaceae bacterium]
MGVNEWLEFPAADQVVAALAKRVGELLTEGVTERGQATLAVSGGSTPIPLFARLAEMELAWDTVTVALVDERWVDTGSPDSNENLVRRHLLQKKAAAARFVGMKNEAATALAGEADCAARLQTLPRLWDCLILGMGNDGHTASLFPGAANLAAATDPHSGRVCMAIHPPAAPHERMTLTLPAILNSRQLILHLQGPEKKKVLARAQEVGDAAEMPIRYILRQQTTPLAVYWSP